MNAHILKAYIDHFLPREVIGPVIIVFSLEGVIDGIFTLYVPDGFATVGWWAVFIREKRGNPPLQRWEEARSRAIHRRPKAGPTPLAW